jgi:predicted outer membrane repeat protein
VIVARQATIPVPGGWPTIQAAYDAAIDGDIIAVASGVYTGDGNRDLLLSGKSVQIKSLSGPEVTTIDCQGSESEPHHAMWFTDSLPTGSVILEGFTIRNAFKDLFGAIGGAVGIHGVTVTMRNCIFLDNYSMGSGGAIHCRSASPVIEDCAFVINHADYGGAISCDGASSLRLKNCTFYGNWAAGKGGSIYFAQSSLEVENCIFAFGTGGAAIDVAETYVGFTITCTDIFGNVGGDWVGPIAGRLGVSGNISLDPLFCDWYESDFHLSSLSPCLPINNSCRVQMGAFGHGCGFFCGDAGNDLRTDVGDAVFLIAYMYRSGPAPEVLAAADVNRNDLVDIGDVVTIINYIFRGGPELECGTR